MNVTRYFQYGEREIEYLKHKDKALARAIDEIGPIYRTVNPDLFASLINSIVGQQISSKAQKTIWIRMQERFGEITPETLRIHSAEEIQSCGMSMKKGGNIKHIAELVCIGAFDLEALHSASDEEVCRRLSELPGIGVWTAEMLMLFSMQRPNILSYGDLAIQRGLRMLYHHRRIDRKLFEKYRRRYSPFASMASLYLWEIASGKYGYRDYAPLKAKKE